MYEQYEKIVNKIKEMGLLFIEEQKTVESNLVAIIKEYGYTLTQLEEISGISKQRISELTKRDTIPSIETALKLSKVLNIPVDKIYQLTEDAWIIPFKNEEGDSIYVDMSNGDLLTHGEVRSIINNSDPSEAYEYLCLEDGRKVTAQEREIMLKRYVAEHFLEVEERILSNNPEITPRTLKSEVIAELKDKFNEQVCVKLYMKLGEKFDHRVAPKQKSKEIISMLK